MRTRGRPMASPRAVALVVWAAWAGGVSVPADPAARAQDVEDAALDPLARLAQLEEAIGALTQELEDDLARKERLAREADGLGETRRATRERLVRRTRGLYRMKRVGMLPIAGGVEGLLAHVARVERFERMVAKDVRALRQLRTRDDAIRGEVARVDEAVELLRGQLRELEERRGAIGEEILAGRFFREGFAAFDAAGPAPLAQGAFAPSSFGAGRAELALPLLTLRAVRDRSYEGGPGLELVGGTGAPVRAVAAGRIAFVGRYADLGSIVIVDHGDDHYAIYGGFGSTDVGVGDAVPAGGRLGALASSGTLFFQLRRGTRALDARVWLGL